MTDKEQIMIDGVDVRGCVYRDSENRCCCDSSKKNEGEERLTGRGGCAYNPNCYFKQRARKTQECEELTKERDYLKQIVDGCPDVACENGGFCAIDIENKRLKQECEDLREDYRELEQRHNEAFQDFERLKQECRELEIKNVTLQNRYQQVAGATTEADLYRNALEEIEEVWAKDEDGDYNFIKWQILNIINKAKGEE